ncbi:hypothetical protein BHYA_0135g00130 [Botrytis hyacinthi]|uniref:Uncharacterized protein n=1 Tax=Botrytis hyacinthi TaxID=278943 RepID=A0A4Z1GR96_9HELO|nr:hypothetical protein BHYA_0135g00130 [Botrytis hyacinthi]
MDFQTLLKDLHGAVEQIHQIQANLTSFGVEEMDVNLKNGLENLFCEWSLARADQTVRAEVGLDEPLDTMLDHLLSSNSSKHLPKSEQEGSTSPRSTKQKHTEKKAHEQKSPVDKMTTYVLFRPHPENPTLPHSHPSQPPSLLSSASRSPNFGPSHHYSATSSSKSRMVSSEMMMTISCMMELRLINQRSTSMIM